MLPNHALFATTVLLAALNSYLFRSFSRMTAQVSSSAFIFFNNTLLFSCLLFYDRATPGYTHHFAKAKIFVFTLRLAILGLSSLGVCSGYWSPTSSNCDSSPICAGSGPICHRKFGKTCMTEIRDLLSSIPDDQTYREGQHLACALTAGHLGICVWGENFINATGTITAKEAKSAVAAMMTKSCDICGNQNKEDKVIKVQYTSKT